MPWALQQALLVCISSSVTAGSVRTSARSTGVAGVVTTLAAAWPGVQRGEGGQRCGAVAAVRRRAAHGALSHGEALPGLRVYYPASCAMHDGARKTGICDPCDSIPLVVPPAYYLHTACPAHGLMMVLSRCSCSQGRLPERVRQKPCHCSSPEHVFNRP